MTCDVTVNIVIWVCITIISCTGMITSAIKDRTK